MESSKFPLHVYGETKLSSPKMALEKEMFPLDEYGLFVFLINDDWKVLIFPELNIGILIPLYSIWYFYLFYMGKFIFLLNNYGEVHMLTKKLL